jgi:predicted transcriptional regulator
MKAFTDYPFTELGDEAYKEAPVREVEVVKYDDNKYCKVTFEGHYLEVKRGYLYHKPVRCGDAPCLSHEELQLLVSSEE